jgi:hypothetical protein
VLSRAFRGKFLDGLNNLFKQGTLLLPGRLQTLAEASAVAGNICVVLRREHHMPSPFPGMDPFLEEESLWPWFQHQLAIILQQMVSAGVGARYSVGIFERRFSAGHQDHCEEYVGIHADADGRLVTLLDIVSPADKLTEAGRTAYRATRRAAQESKANVVEVDLVLRGEATLEYSREGLPPWDYAVTVTRATSPERYEIYTSALEKRLPLFRLPLASDDRDTVVNLQGAFSSAYDICGFGDQIDYRKDPAVPLSVEVWGRVAQVLRERRG